MIQPPSWLPVSPDSDFSVYNLPYGIFSKGKEKARVGVALGEWILDLAAAAQLGLLSEWEGAVSVFEQEVLNEFIAQGRPAWQSLRKSLQRLVTEEESPLRAVADQVLVRQAEARMHLPVRIGDYTDFYSSLEHATNVGKLFRPDNPLMPNWKYLPVAYHGRASSIVVSGTPVHRPQGQILPAGAEVPVLSPTQALDFELELGYIIGKNSPLGSNVATSEAGDYVFGCVLVNDWSARDIQRWEYQPLGPFLSKNFATSISPWVVPMDALVPFQTEGPRQEPPPLPYLRTSGAFNLDLELEVALKPGELPESTLCQTNARYLYWNIRQQIAHHTVTGCNLSIGDLLATGTISGTGPGPSSPGLSSRGSNGCLLELTKGGTSPVVIAGGGQRTYLLDGDEVIMRGFAHKNGLRVGFGEVRGKVLPALEQPGAEG
ncbi:fumarylacetoacetase [Telluribacter sp.]|jgi:fumarylacetoacetase|uniref:fumarylacetoacetase n=1 Tax=Telluribacter sp. TaxID=1978767 RepID=UPI002E11E2E8|nr:fumarylacetoacetase [Telluribacter sp.]